MISEKFEESIEWLEKMRGNTWEEPGTLITTVTELQKLIDDLKWSWSRNMNCKYVDILIDMRDGGFVIRNRTYHARTGESTERISLDAVKWQYSK